MRNFLSIPHRLDLDRTMLSLAYCVNNRSVFHFMQKINK